MSGVRFIAAVKVVFFMLAAISANESARADVDFVKQVKPLLQKHCVSCHGEDSQESGLRLDFGELLLKGIRDRLVHKDALHTDANLPSVGK